VKLAKIANDIEKQMMKATHALLGQWAEKYGEKKKCNAMELTTMK
jgi:hypothetical protein